MEPNKPANPIESRNEPANPIESRFQIRGLRKGDMHAYLRLLPQLSAFTWPPDAEQRFAEFFEELGDKHRVLVAEDLNTGVVVAAATLLIEPKCIHDFGKVAHIEDVVVDDLFRNCGIGMKIVQRVARVAEDVGCYKILLNCKEDRCAFYTKCEFEIKGREMARYF